MGPDYCFKSITAAHCMVFRERNFEPEDVRIGLGKLYSDFYRQESSSIISTVSSTHICTVFACVWAFGKYPFGAKLVLQVAYLKNLQTFS